MTKSTSQKVYLVSLGCPKNLVDAENILASISEEYEVIKNPQNADVIIVNTCSFIKSATEETIDAILEASRFKANGRCKQLIVSGCLAGRYSVKDLKKNLPEVDLFVKPNEKEKILNFLKIKNSLNCKHDNLVLNFTPSHRAYLKIADGCSNRCAYCTIPSIRGKLKSRPISDIIKEAENLFKAGIKEITLVAQDTSAYGNDFNSKTNILSLLNKLKSLADDNHWIRILYSQPKPILLDVADFLIANKGFAPYLDVPIQHISKRILKLMNRNVETKNIIRQLKQKNIFLRTTVMTGFPGEIKKDFNELYTFLEEIKFDHLGAFSFSPEEGTKAFRMKEKVSSKIAQHRLDMIMNLQAEISQEKMKSFVGKKIDILIDGKNEDGKYFGRHIGQAPEIDGIVIVNNSKKVGSFVNAKVKSVFGDYDLVADIK